MKRADRAVDQLVEVTPKRVVTPRQSSVWNGTRKKVEREELEDVGRVVTPCLTSPPALYDLHPLEQRDVLDLEQGTPKGRACLQRAKAEQGHVRPRVTGVLCAGEGLGTVLPQQQAVARREIRNVFQIDPTTKEVSDQDGLGARRHQSLGEVKLRGEGVDAQVNRHCHQF